MKLVVNPCATFFISHMHRIRSVTISFLSYVELMPAYYIEFLLRLSGTEMNIFERVISSLYFWWQFWFFTSCLPGVSHFILDSCSKCPWWKLVNVELLVFGIEFLRCSTISWFLVALFFKWWILLFAHWASPCMFLLNCFLSLVHLDVFARGSSELAIPHLTRFSVLVRPSCWYGVKH